MKNFSAHVVEFQSCAGSEKSRESLISGYLIWSVLSCSHCMRVLASWENGYCRDMTLHVTSPMFHLVTNSQSAGGGPQSRMSSGRWSISCMANVIVQRQPGSC